ncbi:ABC transporter ATP-binding protein [Spongisporangium articulatum]
MRVVAKGALQEKPVFVAAVVGSAAYGVGTAAGGWLLGHVVETVLTPAFAAGHIATGELLRAAGLIALVAVVTAAGVASRRVAAGVTMFRLQARYRRALTRQFLRLPLQWHHRHPAGQLLSISNADVEATWQIFAPLPMALGVVVMLVVAVVAMFAADPVLALIGLLVLPLIVLANAWYQRHMSPAVMHAQALRAEVSDVAHESFEAATVVKTLGRETAETERFGAAARQLRDANVRVGRLRSQFDPLMEALPTVGTLLVLAVGAWRVSRGAAQIGDLVQVAYLLQLVAFPLRATGWVLGELPRTAVGWERMSIVLDAGARDARSEGPEGPEGPDGDEPMTYGDVAPAGAGAVGLRADGVHYAYSGPDGERFPVLHDVTFEVPAGRTVAIVGPTGSGKSTLSSLLVRLVDPADGRILLDGVDLRALRAGGVAEAAAYVPQSTFVFADTIRDNVRLGDPALDDDRVWQALDVARAARFVRALPDGLDTVVGERGATLSGGQRQRLVLARALVRSPRLLVLDDATSAIDPRVEAEILAGLRPSGDGQGAEDAPPVTVLVVAYRRATIALADEVVYVEGGRVLDRGTHDELLERSDGYRKLVTAYDSQDDADDADDSSDLEGELEGAR